MPQYVTLSIAAKIDKGPEIKSEVKFEASSYGPVLEESVCRNQCEVFELPIGDVSCIDMIVISSDKYMADKDSCTNHSGIIKPDCSRIYYKFIDAMPEPSKSGGYTKEDFETWGALKNNHTLSRPQVFVEPGICSLTEVKDIQGIAIRNDLPFEIKVSVLVVRKSRKQRLEQCPEAACTPCKK
ncbi:MAG TPA: hypothetical protein VGM98_22110 [Schlesneria sp.]|jgi:hypothetical protein